MIARHESAPTAPVISDMPKRDLHIGSLLQSAFRLCSLQIVSQGSSGSLIECSSPWALQSQKPPEKVLWLADGLKIVQLGPQGELLFGHAQRDISAPPP